MNKLTYVIIILMILTQSSQGQTTPSKQIFNKDFNWTITIPENFENVNAEEWAKLQNKGLEAVEKTYDAEVVNNAKSIFIFKSDQFNYFESNQEPFDTSNDGDYRESFREVSEVVYNTFKAQMPGVKLDSLSSEETIDGLKFNTFKIDIELPNKMVLTCLMYSRLFDKKALTVSVMTLDSNKQKVLLDAFRNSKFGKK